jgi:hypothetical protein
MQEIEAKFDLVHKMHGDYGHFDLVFPYFRSINQYTNGNYKHLVSYVAICIRGAHLV